METWKKRALEKAWKEGLALSYKDVRVEPNYSEMKPEEANTKTLFSRNVNLKIPFASAAMDTVTEQALAIEIAKHGGIGIIHRNLSVEEQAKQVAKVKHNLHGLIENPICVHENETIKDIEERRKIKGYDFHTFPVLGSERKLVGILTSNDFDFCNNKSKTAKEIMTKEIVTAPENTDMEEAYRIMMKEKKKTLPLINKTGGVNKMYVFKDVKRIMEGNEESYNLDSKGRLIVGAAIGTGIEELERAAALLEKNVDVIVLDTAHADTKSAIKTLKELKNNYSIDVVVGNVSVGEAALRLAEAGADGIKVGQGPGSICTTRIIAGIGVPQVSAVYECVKIIKKYEVPVCADGGIHYSGDVVIAIAAGAHSVMIGSGFAGTEEAPGEIIRVDGQAWKLYRGMGSLGAMEESSGSRERYMQGDKSVLVPEGVEGKVPYKGKISDILSQYIGGLKKGMGYTGSRNINELRNNTTIRKITNAGHIESHPHNIDIVKEPSNYTVKK